MDADPMAAKRAGARGRLSRGPLAPFLQGEVAEVGTGPLQAADGSLDAVLAAWRLQDAGDHRAVLREWFGAVRTGGHLVVAVPHAFLFERQQALPSRWAPRQRRLYTPRSLMDEVEEALEPNSYRVRHLGDDDLGYDYGLPPEVPPVGGSDVLLAIEKVAPPAWPLDARAPATAPAPDYAFEPGRTRVEALARLPARRVLVLKLDHLGDFILGLPALRRAREVFADAHLTLVVGSWNAGVAAELGLADEVVAFDAFPPNSSEGAVDVHATAGQFAAALPGAYDLAVDLRTDTDTRLLLGRVRARTRAGIGTRARFPFLDIALPLDGNRNEVEAAHEYLFDHHAFSAQGSTRRSRHRTVSRAAGVERDCAIVWGPYLPLRPGQYLFDPFVELAADTGGGVVALDVALDGRLVRQAYLPAPEPLRLAFSVERPGASFEFRIWTVADQPSVDLSFFGGRLIRAGADSVLHQSEYPQLLVELVRLRTAGEGVLADAA